MKKEIITSLVILLPSSPSLSLASSAFVRVDSKSFQVQENQALENMPRVRSQDSIGICFGMSSATVAQYFHCTTKRIDCTRLSAKNEISPLSAVAWANTNSPKGGAPTPTNHENIQFSGSGAQALKNASKNFLYMAESCYPFDQFANRYGTDQKVTEALIANLEKKYSRSQAAADVCLECDVQEINKSLGTSATVEQLKSSFRKESFGQFLYSLIFDHCEDMITQSQKPQYSEFPSSPIPASDQKLSASERAALLEKTEDELIQKAKVVLSSGFPLLLDGICPAFSNGKCQADQKGEVGLHSVVISGYRKMCKPSGECRDVFKVHNSWGEDWQKAHDGGWVDARTMLKSVSARSGQFKTATLSWYTK